MTVVDLFAGAGGWDLGARAIGLNPIGYEVWAPAIATRQAARLPTVVCDLGAALVNDRQSPVAGLIASPPCQDWSAAGKRLERTGPSGALVDVPLRWALELRPRWCAWEQVPPALEVWELAALHLRAVGYRVWTGILNAADFGVPQTRQRAFLLASLDGPALPPEPTHGRAPEPGLFGTLAPWVTMGDAIDVDGHRAPAGDLRMDVPTPDLWVDSPATTVTGDPRISPRCSHHDGGPPQSAGAVDLDDQATTDTPLRLTLAQALTLQTFPADYPVQGTKSEQFQQVGNAVPPRMAAAVLGALVGY